MRYVVIYLEPDIFQNITTLDMSSALFVLSTPFGKYRLLRVLFNISYQKRQKFKNEMYKTLKLEGVDVCIADLLKWDKIKHEHDDRIKEVIRSQNGMVDIQQREMFI